MKFEVCDGVGADDKRSEPVRYSELLQLAIEVGSGGRPCHACSEPVIVTHWLERGVLSCRCLTKMRGSQNVEAPKSRACHVKASRVLYC